MDNTPFSSKCEILYDFYMNYSDEYEEFIDENDIGVPAAVLSYIGAATLTDKGIHSIEETWISLCDILQIDSYGNYPTIEFMMEFANAEG